VQEAARRRASADASLRTQDAGRRAASAPAGGASRRAALEWLRWRPNLAAAALAVAVVVLAVVALVPSGGGGGTRVIHAEVLVPRASASLSVSDGRAQMSIVGMPQSGAGRVYEVWTRRSGSPQPTDALFTVTAGGDATVAVPGSVAGVREVLVTSEPLGGSRVPTRMPVIVARIS
jgi:hypothetical protein